MRSPIAVGAAVLLGACDPNTALRPALALDEIVAFRPPSTFALAGAFVSPSGYSLAWSSQDRRILVADSLGSVIVVSSAFVGAPIGAAFGRNHRQLEVVDGGDSVRLVRIDVSGDMVSSTKLAIPFRASQAVRTSRGDWFVLGQDETSKSAFAVAAAPEYRVRRLMLPPGLSGGWSGSGVRIQADGETALIRGPLVSDCVFRASRDEESVTAVLQTSTDRCLGEKESAPSRAAPQASSPALMHLSTLPLGDGYYLQTLADPRTDTRELRVLSEQGGVERASKVVAPISLLAASTAGWILGTREPRTTEVVLYRWRWKR
jgi:hypothetical protein